MVELPAGPTATLMNSIHIQIDSVKLAARGPARLTAN